MPISIYNEATADSKTLWTLITIDDTPEFVSGKSVLDILQLFLEVEDFKFAILNDIQGAGKDWLISELQEKSNLLMKIEDLPALLLEVDTFEWGDFFLFKESPVEWVSPQKRGYAKSVSQSDTTIRVVDNQYLYIYTPLKEVVEVCGGNYKFESMKEALLSELDFPY